MISPGFSGSFLLTGLPSPLDPALLLWVDTTEVSPHSPQWWCNFLPWLRLYSLHYHCVFISLALQPFRQGLQRMVCSAFWFYVFLLHHWADLKTQFFNSSETICKYQLTDSHLGPGRLGECDCFRFTDESTGLGKFKVCAWVCKIKQRANASFTVGPFLTDRYPWKQLVEKRRVEVGPGKSEDSFMVLGKIHQGHGCNYMFMYLSPVGWSLRTWMEMYSFYHHHSLWCIVCI